MGRFRAGLVSGVWVILVFVAVLGVVLNVPSAGGSGTTFIRADGSIEPPTAPITSADNITYYFTDNIYGEIVIERSDIIIDGEGFTLQGLEGERGFFFHGINNVTIKETNIVGFGCAIYAWSSSGNNFFENTINGGGIFLWEHSNNNTVTKNSITNSIMAGIALVDSSSYNNILRNTIRYGRWSGISVSSDSLNNTISENYIADNSHGIVLGSVNNTVLGNIVANNVDRGIMVYGPYNLLKNNTIFGSLYNVGFGGFEEIASPHIQDVDSSNTVNGKPIYYWVNRQNTEVPTDAGYVALVNCYNITLKGLELKNNEEGMLLANTTNLIITNSNLTTNSIGMWLYQSSNNILSKNIIINNYIGAILYRSSTNNVVSENTITNNNGGGMWLYRYSDNNAISNNVITNNGEEYWDYGGIQLGDPYGFYWSSSNNTIFGNVIIGNREHGIKIWTGSSYNTIYENTITSSGWDGISLSWDASFNNITRNTVTGNGYIGIYLDTSFNTIAENTIMSNVASGIAIAKASFNSISKNTIMENYDGIYVFNQACNNSFFENTIANNGRYGAVFDESSNNKIYHNNFLYPYLLIVGSVNIWDDGYPSGGNYWSGYNGTDYCSGPGQNQTGSDGIGDTPYNIDENNRDEYPFMSPYENVAPVTIDDYDGLWHNNDFSITLIATDIGSGVAKTYYKINDGAIQNIAINGQPLITTEGADNKLEYWSIDNVGNEELPHKILTEIKLDKTYPSIETPSRTPDGDVLPDQPVKVSVNVTDAISQVKNVTLSYTINDGEMWTDLPMNHTASNLYEATIPPQQAGITVRFKIIAYDYAGNNATLDGTQPYCVYQVIPEFPPSLILPIFMIITLLAATAYKRKHLPL